MIINGLPGPARRRLRWLVVLTAVLVLAGCATSSIPLTDGSESGFDPRLGGAWIQWVEADGQLRPILVIENFGFGRVGSWPLRVGAVRRCPGRVARGLRDADAAVSEAARVVFGQDVLAGFDWALGQRFASVLELDALPPDRSAPSGIAGIVGLASVRAHPGSRQLMLDVEFRAPEGQLLEVWTVTGTAGVDPLAGPILMPWGGLRWRSPTSSVNMAQSGARRSAGI